MDFALFSQSAQYVKHRYFTNRFIKAKVLLFSLSEDARQRL